ncbi:hypothetical protein QOT17_011912 [Balamuthia mandrillaris]
MSPSSFFAVVFIAAALLCAFAPSATSAACGDAVNQNNCTQCFKDFNCRFCGDSDKKGICYESGNRPSKCSDYKYDATVCPSAIDDVVKALGTAAIIGISIAAAAGLCCLIAVIAGIVCVVKRRRRTDVYIVGEPGRYPPKYV